MYCPKCGTLNDDTNKFCIECGASLMPFSNAYAQNNVRFDNRIRCKRCNSENINITFETVELKTKSKEETRKKSVVTRTGNKLGRAAMIGMSGGLWALTPKKSDYVSRGKANSQYVQNKIAICQDCGYSWRIF